MGLKMGPIYSPITIIVDMKAEVTGKGYDLPRSYSTS